MLGALSDHAALCATLPWAVARTSTNTAHAQTVYRWIDGSRLDDYSVSWRAWNEYTANSNFAADFQSVIDANRNNVESLAAAAEQFLLQEAIKAGVVTKKFIKPASNPNKRLKCLAPWFSEECRTAKLAYKQAVKCFGRNSDEAKAASCAFSAAC